MWLENQYSSRMGGFEAQAMFGQEQGIEVQHELSKRACGSFSSDAQFD